MAEESGTFTRLPEPAASPTRGSLSPRGSTARQPRVDEEERVDNILEVVVVDERELRIGGAIADAMAVDVAELAVDEVDVGGDEVVVDE